MATWNGAPTLPRVLEACCRLVPPEDGWSLLVIDDGSTDGTREVLGEFVARLPLRFVTQARRGKHAALNLALQLVLEHDDAALYLFIDDDAIPAPDWLLRIGQCAREQSAHAVFGGTIAAEWSEPPPAWVPGVVPLEATYGVTTAPEGPVAPDMIRGANMAVRRAVFEAGYRFDVSLGTSAAAYAIGSDTELTRRLGAAGYACWFCPAATVGRFIRRHQVRARFILQRAWRAGRSAQLQGTAIGAPHSALARELWGAVAALAGADFEALLRRRWELAYLRGFFYQAWFGGGHRLTRGARVLIACGAAQPDGIAARMAQEARLLAAAGCHSSIATARFGGQQQYAELLRADGVQASVFDAPRFAEQRQWLRTRQFGARLLAARQLRRYRSDLLHVACCGAGDGASLLWLAHHCQLAVVVSIHHALPPLRLQPWLMPLYAQAFRSVRGVYAVSAPAMTHFMATFGRFVPAGARLCVIPNSVDTARFVVSPERRAAARARLGLAPDGLVLGSAAPFEPDQRPEALVELFCALRNRFERLQLVLAGAGTLEAALRAKVELLGLGAQVVFCGAGEPAEQLLPALDLHLALGRADAGGRAILEALACGVPVVASDFPGGADILRASQAGLLLAPGDARAAIEAVAQLLGDAPRRAAMALHARAEVEAGHTPQLLEQRLRAFYAGLPP